MADLSSAIRKFNRFELKYLLPIDRAAAFRHDLQAFLQPDQHGDDAGRYGVISLYYDSPDHRFYWEKLEGIKFRRKLRIRHYQGPDELTADCPVFVEIKQRLDRVTQKRRVILPYRDALLLCNGREIPEHDPRDRPVIDEIYAMLWQYDLRPTTIVSYTREAFVGSDYDVGLRVTFDTNLRFRGRNLQLHDRRDEAFMLPPRLLVMEIKANERVPYWLTELVGAHNFRLIRVSKYCQSLEATAMVPQSKFFIG